MSIKDLKTGKEIKIVDTTLRDGEQKSDRSHVVL